MDRKIVYVYLPDGLADWEIGFVLPELHTGQYFKKGIQPYMIKTFAITVKLVVTMAGFHIIPDLSLDDLITDQAALILLPGSYSWLKTGHEPVLNSIKKIIKKDILVAAICGATIALGKYGILDNYEHTSSDLSFLKSVCPIYKGEARYRNELVVTDKNLITASGIAPVEFGREILKKLNVMSNETLETWYNLYKTQNPKYYFKLTKSS